MRRRDSAGAGSRRKRPIIYFYGPQPPCCRHTNDGLISEPVLRIIDIWQMMSDRPRTGWGRPDDTSWDLSGGIIHIYINGWLSWADVYGCRFFFIVLFVWRILRCIPKNMKKYWNWKWRREKICIIGLLTTEHSVYFIRIKYFENSDVNVIWCFTNYHF